MRHLLLILTWLCATAAVAHPGRGIVVADDGSVWVADAVRSVVWRIDTDGTLHAAAREVHAHWLARAPDGAVLADHVVYEPARNTFLRGLVAIDPGGARRTVVAPAADPDGLDGGSFVAFDGAVAVARDSAPVIELRGPTATPRRIPLPAPTAAPVTSMGVDGAGRLWIARERSLLRLDADGGIARRIDLPSATDAPLLGLTALWGLAHADDGTVFTTDPGTRRVLAIDPDDRVEVVLTAEPPWFPTGVATRGGRLWLLEHGLDAGRNLGPRVRVGSIEGPFSVLAEVVE